MGAEEKHPRADLLSTAEAAAQIGITPAQFTRLAKKLGLDHDDTRPNPKYPTAAAPMRFWLKRTIARFAKRKAVKAFLEGAAKRSATASAAAKAGVKTKTDKLLAECEAWEPKLETMTVGRAVTLAIEAYNCRQGEVRSGLWASASDSPEFLARITRNFLRHECSDYHDALARLAGRCGGDLAYEVAVRAKIDDAINEEFPDLEDDIANALPQLREEEKARAEEAERRMREDSARRKAEREARRAAPAEEATPACA